MRCIVHALEEDLIREFNRMSVQSGIRSNRTALTKLHSPSQQNPELP